MGCETENCPPCKIEVGAIYILDPVKLPFGLLTRAAYHLFILHTNGNRKIVYRGGPEWKNTYRDAAKKGLATEFGWTRKSTIRDYVTGEAGTVWGWLIAHRMEGLANNPDYIFMVDLGLIAEGPDYCGLDEKFTETIIKVDALELEYNAISVTRTDNSNGTVRTILRHMGLPERKPDGGRWVDMFGFEHDAGTNPAPGWEEVFDFR